ncbi:heat shock 70 kDa protein 12A-like [Mya arenaria]|uniref:heat shock 70 kDa protein 12A-like n=1 Tax=Mya arenaria TaxID=6604 RepID=UPI0022E528B2|nr:heat shock 70 kDa protein 12A-like [Mya arenaria]
MSSSSKTKKTISYKLVVAAIDFGSTFSRYAYSMNHDFNENPSKVSTNSDWVAGGQLISHEAPTVLLLNPDRTFKAFGYDAESQYGELAAQDAERDDGKLFHKEHFYFRRFKMKLYKTKNLMRSTEIEDEQGRKMNAIEVFSICIKYLSDEFRKLINKRVTQIKETDIHWVITVPAIWNDASKQFMREAAEKTGLDGSRLTIALEPEAASLFCMHVPVDKMAITGKPAVNKSPQISNFPIGTKYMVVNAGGGTIDISVHEVIDEGHLKELNWASGGAWGGTMVDKAFEDFIIKLFGIKSYEEFKKNHVEDLVDLQRELELKKRSISVSKEGKETLKLPVTLCDVYTELTKKSPQDAIKDNKKFAGKVTYTAGKLRVDCDVMRSWFKECCEKTIDHVSKLLKQPESAGTNTILMVGGFSESMMLQEQMKAAFGDKRLIIPEDAGLAVLKGAVIFGHDPLTIASRIAKCSYGICVYRDFNPSEHPQDKLVRLGSRKKCKDIFARHVKKGDELVVGQAQSTLRYSKLEEDQISLDFDIYTSPEDNPKFVDGTDCTFLGKLEVEVPHEKSRGIGVFVSMIFGGTELTVIAKEEKSGKIKKATFNFLK